VPVRCGLDVFGNLTHHASPRDHPLQDRETQAQVRRALKALRAVVVPPTDQFRSLFHLRKEAGLVGEASHPGKEWGMSQVVCQEEHHQEEYREDCRWGVYHLCHLGVCLRVACLPGREVCLANRRREVYPQVACHPYRRGAYLVRCHREVYFRAVYHPQGVRRPYRQEAYLVKCHREVDFQAACHPQGVRRPYRREVHLVSCHREAHFRAVCRPQGVHRPYRREEYLARCH